MDYMSYKTIQVIKKSERAEIIFAAVDGIEKPVVIKRLTEANPEIYRQVAKIDSPHIPRIYCVEMQEDEPTLPLYPTEYVTVQSSGARLYFLPLQSSDVQMVATNTQRLAYYGKIESDGSTWYYVYFSGCFGYVRQEDVTRVQINLHPTPLPQPELPQPTPPQAPSVETPTTPTTNPTNEIMLVAFAGILAAALTCALFLPKQKDKPNSFYHENR